MRIFLTDYPHSCVTLYMYPLLLMSSVAVILDQHIKIPPNLKRAWRVALFSFGRDRAAHQSTVFLFGGLVSKLLSNKASFFLNKSKKLQSSVNSIPKGIALWYSYPSTLRTNRRYFFPIHHPENSRESILLMQGNPQ